MGCRATGRGLDVKTIGAGYSRTLGEWGFLNLSASVSTAEQRTTELQLGWTLPFGERASASTVLRHRTSEDSDAESEAEFGVQQSLPVGSGSGYDLRRVHQQRPAPRLRVPGPGRHGQPRLRPRRRQRGHAGGRDRRAGDHRQRRDAEPRARPELRGRERRGLTPASRSLSTTSRSGERTARVAC